MLLLHYRYYTQQAATHRPCFDNVVVKDGVVLIGVLYFFSLDNGQLLHCNVGSSSARHGTIVQCAPTPTFLVTMWWPSSGHGQHFVHHVSRKLTVLTNHV